jgi:hypothetical protein
MIAIDERKRSIPTSAQRIAAEHGTATPLGMHEVD